MSDAAHCYREALTDNPANVQALHRLALACVHLNHFDDAASSLASALQLAPLRVELWELAARVAALLRQYARAEAYFHRALELGGDTAALHRNLGDCLRVAGRLVDAKRHYARTLAIEPDCLHAIRAVAHISTHLGHLDDAADASLNAWRLEPAHLQGALDMIAALAAARRSDQLDEAVAQVIALHTGNADAADAAEALCLALYQADRFADLLDAARAGLQLHPGKVALHHYAAHALSVRGFVQEALVHARAAVRLAPNDPILDVQLGLLELNESEYRQGWSRVNRFYTMPAARVLRVFPDAPIWNGEPVAGRTFLLVGEQGLGDEIQFIRFAEWLFQRGATVDVLVREPVAQLAAGMRSIRHVYTQLPDAVHDFSCHMQRMPEHMKLDLSMLPIAMPYLQVSPPLIDRWRTHLAALAPTASQPRRLRIGLAWSGGGLSALSRFQSVELNALRPLLSLPGITWFSIQKGASERDSEALAHEFDIHTLGPQIASFADTLAIMKGLDLVITVDTSVAHLAGAANIPVWVLIPVYAQWRWLQDRTDSPWYPSMRLFRQKNLTDWHPPVEEIKKALVSLANPTATHAVRSGSE